MILDFIAVNYCLLFISGFFFSTITKYFHFEFKTSNGLHYDKSLKQTKKKKNMNNTNENHEIYEMYIGLFKEI